MPYYDSYGLPSPNTKYMKFCNNCYYVSKIKKSRGIPYDGTCTCKSVVKYLRRNSMLKVPEARCSKCNRANECCYHLKAEYYRFAIFGKATPFKSKWIGRILQIIRMKQQAIEWERLRALEDIS